MSLACFPLNRWKIATFFYVSAAISVELATLLLNDILRKSSSLFFNDFPGFDSEKLSQTSCTSML